MISPSKDLNIDESKRAFVLLLASTSAVVFSPFDRVFSDAAALVGNEKVFSESSVRVGQWILENTHEEDLGGVIAEEAFISSFHDLSDVEVQGLVSDDFRSGRVVDIGGLNFSNKEAAVCLLAAISRNAS